MSFWGKILSVVFLIGCSVETAKVPSTEVVTEERSNYSLNVFSGEQELKSTMFFWKTKDTMPQVMRLSAKMKAVKSALHDMFKAISHTKAIKRSFLRDRLGEDNLIIYESFLKEIKAKKNKIQRLSNKIKQEMQKPEQDRNIERIERLKEKIAKTKNEKMVLKQEVANIEEAYLARGDKKKIAQLDQEIKSLSKKAQESEKMLKNLYAKFVSLVDMIEKPPILLADLNQGSEQLDLQNFAMHPSKPCSSQNGSIVAVSTKDHVLRFTAFCRQRPDLKEGLVDAYTFELERMDPNSSTLEGNFVRCTNDINSLQKGDCGLARFGVATFEP